MFTSRLSQPTPNQGQMTAIERSMKSPAIDPPSDPGRGPVRYAEARLPTPHGDFRLVVYRVPTDVPGGYEEHVAMVRGDIAGGDDVLTRVHSSCFTGEVLGSLRCDCRDQLDHALARIAAEGRGVVVYLVQEGRGIGLGNKIRAYALQDDGVDTVDANLALGFDADHRSYGLAASMLHDLGVGSVRLMTNNPEKIRGLEAAGVAVAAQEPHWVGSTEHSAAYLEVKQTRMGHITTGNGTNGASNGTVGAGGSATQSEADRKRETPGEDS
jgi:GTP cyclohydrolase II